MAKRIDGGWAGACLASVCCASLCGVGLAHAQGEAGPASSGDSGAASGGPPLVWQAPASCPTGEDVLAQVAALASRDDMHWGRFEQIRARVEGAGARWALTLEFVGAGGSRRREMRSGRCDELAEAAAVAIVLAHRGDAAPEWGADASEWGADALAPPAAAPPAAAPPAAAPPAATPPAATPAPAAADAVVPAPRAGEPLVPVLGAEVLLDPTTLGSVAFGAGVGLELRAGRLSAALNGALFPSVETALGADQAIALGLWTGGARGCLRWGRALDTCLHFELGQLSAEGVGLVQPSQERELWAAPGLSAAFTSSPFDGFGVTTRVSLYHPLVRGRYRVDESDVVHQIPALTFRVALGVAIPLS